MVSTHDLPDTAVPSQPASAGTAPLLSLSGVSKRFPGVRALHNVQLSLRPGEVMALLGENGAGKSTIVKILTGIYQPDEGEIRIDGQPVHFHGPRDAWARGITAIHQETVMFDELTVAENVFMGHMPVGGARLVDWNAIRARTRALFQRLDCDIDPQAPLKTLGVAQKHQVEIARALSHDARIVIMDEPTAALAVREVESVLTLIRQLPQDALAVILISHRLDGVFEVTDRIVVLRQGQVAADLTTKETKMAEVVSYIVGAH